jgi:hypothetical protein
MLRPSDETPRSKKESPIQETLCEYTLFSANLYNTSQPFRTVDLLLLLNSAIATWHLLHYEFARATWSVSPVNEVPAPKDASADAQSDLLCNTYKAARTEASQKKSALLFCQLQVCIRM